MFTVSLPPIEDGLADLAGQLDAASISPDPGCDAIVQAAALVCGVPISFISLLGEDRQRFRARVGLDGAAQAACDEAFCAHTLRAGDLLEVRDAQEDPRFCAAAPVKEGPGIRFYAGLPLTLSNGAQAGTFCVMDSAARSLDDKQRALLRGLAAAACHALDNWTGARLLESERDERERELRIVNHQLERTARHLAKARDDADRASRAKSRFLAGMSHELRTPLNGILGYAQLLRMEGGLNASQDRRLGSMLDAGTHLMEMINSVLELSEIESGHVELHPVDVDLSKLALASLDLVRPRADAKGLRLICNADLTAPRALVTDQMRLRQIILNLLGNAVKFTETGQVELRLRAIPSRAAFRFEIADTGPGVKPDQREWLFKDFERLEADLSGKVEGAGLGLALSSRLAALLGGRIGYDDNDGGGSIFWLELPLQAAVVLPNSAAPLGDLPVPSGMRSELSGGKPGACARLRVLVVDDVAMNRDIACTFLRAAGHDAISVGGGAEAVEAVLSGGIDVVLMDVRMPDVDGLEATRRIRQLPLPACQVPIIGLTAQAFTEQVLACTQAGMDSHVSKPYTPDALRDAVIKAAALPRDRITALRPEPQAPAAPELPVRDPEAVERMAKYLAPPVIDAYLRTVVSRCESVSEALRTPGALVCSPASLAEAAHVLAGSAGMLGFTRLADDGVRLEQALQTTSPDVPVLAVRLAKAIDATLGEILKLPHPEAACEGCSFRT